MQLSGHIRPLHELSSFHICVVGIYSLELNLLAPSLCARTSIGTVPGGFFDKTFSVAFLAVEILDEWHVTNSFFMALWPNAGYGSLIHEVSRSHKTTHRSRYDSSGWVIRSSQRPLSDTILSRNRHLCPAGFRSHSLRRRTAADLRLRPRGPGICYQLLVFSESMNRILCCSLIVAPSVKKLPACFGNEGKNKIPIGTYSEPGGSSVHPSILFF